MRTSILLLVLMSALVSAAQTPVQTKPDPDKPQAATEPAAMCPCCRKMMADKKDARSCCNHDQDSKATTCCSGKDTKCGMKADKGKAAESCCMGEKSSSDTDKGGCCAKQDKSPDHSAMACCGSGRQHCGMGHDHPDISK